MARRRQSRLHRPNTVRPCLLQLEARDVPSTYFVKTTADNGDNGSPTLGSLREGIGFVNGFGFTTILFSLPPGSVITPPAELPPLMKSATVDGKGVVELNGKSAGPAAGLVLLAGGGVSGLAINGFASGGVVLKGAPAKVDSSFIGTNLGGTVAIPNMAGGVIVESAGHTITGNVISGNGKDGVYLKGGSAKSNIITGNLIGVGLDGKSPLGNKGSGVFIDGGSGNTIGGTTGSTTNIISGNGGPGVKVFGPTAGGNVILGNRIGVAAGGAVAVPNGADGVLVEEAPGTIIGGPAPGSENVISGNKGNGVLVMAVGMAAGTVIDHNFIGIDEAGTGDLGNAGVGVAIKGATGSTISANLISGNDSGGVSIAVGGKNTLVANRIGTNEFATAAVPNKGPGIAIGSADNVVGGYKAIDRNFIAGNTGPGVLLISPDAKFNRVAGNFIGVDSTGLVALPNAAEGVRLFGGPSFNVIGGGDGDDGASDGKVLACNVISGNGLSGVTVAVKASTGNLVLGNYVGLDVAGKGVLPNGAYGIFVEGGVGNEIGGAAPGEGNFVAGNSLSGVAVRGDDATGNTVYANVIGLTDEPLPLPAGNKGYGVWVSDKASKNFIGTSGAGNTIAYNGSALALKGHGIVVELGAGNTISRNLVFKNAGRGIDINGDGPTFNDPLDADTGGNGGQDYPLVVARPAGGPDAGVHTWRLNSTPGREFTVELFENPTLDPAEYGEGMTYITSLKVTTDADGNATFAVDHTGRSFLTATATDSVTGDTSEFSLIDTDADGLCDVWELAKGIDFDEDGVLTAAEEVLTDADRLHRDLYVEVDAMVGFAPGDAVFDKTNASSLQHAFSLATDANVHNPDGKAGVTLHIVYDEKALPVTDFKTVDDPFADMGKLKNGVLGDGTDGTFGTPAQRGDAKWADIRKALKLTHRYGLFAKQWRFTQTDAKGNPVLDKAGNPVVVASSSGVAELGGNDFMVTFGAPAWGKLAPALDDTDRAGTFMHELGHCLGLEHGGAPGDEDNYKPNYYSVMNYSWQYPNSRNRVRVRTAAYGPWKLDYSGEVLPDLDELALAEGTGITSPVAFTVPYGTGRKIDLATAGPASTVDWNLKLGVQGGAVSADINFSGGRSVLRGHNDWVALQYAFSEEPGFADGAAIAIHQDEGPPADYLPHVESVTVNDGSAQRSRVTGVTVTFDQPVTLPANPADAFVLIRQSDNAAVGLVATVGGVSQTVVTLSFTGTSAVEFGSLADGRYTLTVLGTQVSNDWGLMDGDDDGIQSGDFIYASAGTPSPPSNIFRLFGDADGDGDVDVQDFGAFRATFGTAANLAFDADGDGDVDVQDFGQFRARFGTSV